MRVAPAQPPVGYQPFSDDGHPPPSGAATSPDDHCGRNWHRPTLAQDHPIIGCAGRGGAPPRLAAHCDAPHELGAEAVLVPAEEWWGYRSKKSTGSCGSEVLQR